MPFCRKLHKPFLQNVFRCLFPFYPYRKTATCFQEACVPPSLHPKPPPFALSPSSVLKHDLSECHYRFSGTLHKAFRVKLLVCPKSCGALLTRVVCSESCRCSVHVTCSTSLLTMPLGTPYRTLFPLLVQGLNPIKLSSSNAALR